jgi:hypothetical protein
MAAMDLDQPLDALISAKKKTGGKIRHLLYFKCICPWYSLLESTFVSLGAAGKKKNLVGGGDKRSARKPVIKPQALEIVVKNTKAGIQKKKATPKGGRAPYTKVLWLLSSFVVSLVVSPPRLPFLSQSGA